MDASLSAFAAPTRAWFSAVFERPTEVQERGWAEIAAGRHALLSAPTGSGKTLAAFLWCLDRLASEAVPPEAERCRVLYISPLRALAVDVERNLRAPLRGIALEAERRGEPAPDIRVAIRTGDTPERERREIVRHPPDILITTPETLFLMLTSGAREVLRNVQWVIVDEIHALAGNKRGAHLALSLERLAQLTARDPQRIGLSATQRPLEEITRFLGGRDRDVRIVDAGRRKELELRVEVPVDDMVHLEIGVEEPAGPAAALGTGPSLPRRSIWPAIVPRILEQIRAHTSTIVFVNSRRLAERLAAQINELAGEELVSAHHGSIAREQRLAIEERLKRGDIPALVATSSLELGIDMGAVDHVIQVGSPGAVAAGMQRIGRAGHSIDTPSKGTLFPTHRADLLETAVLVERMREGAIETTRIPRNPIDVLAQQIVAMAAMDEWSVDDLHRVVSNAYPFADLGLRALEATLDMLDGRYPSEEFIELRPRIVWDRAAGTVRARAGAQRLAITSGGTIPDRGLYSVVLLDDSRKVGELDEEMVYELRTGETFILGASTWRCAEITHSQVRVVPAPGEPGKVAFWHGDAPGRPVEVAAALGAEIRELRSAGPEAARQRLRDSGRMDERAADNLLAFLSEQAESTGTVPDDRTIVVERFRDQLGDWRICVLTPWGARVHAPWALVAAARLREQLDVDVQSIHSDDGFALRIPDLEQPPGSEAIFLDPDTIVDLVTERLHDSALFASRFRENAARALLLPRRRPGERTPLWQQRQRAASLLQVVARYPSFPILAETYRECLRDIFDLDALSQVLRGIRSRSIRVVEVETAQASPFAASLVFEYIAQYMYEGDAPLAERRAQALTLDRELLAELLGSDDLRELLDAGAVAAIELELQRLDGRRPPRDPDETLDMLRALGDLDDAECAARGVQPPWLGELERRRRALRLPIGGGMRWIAADDAVRYRDALGVALPPGAGDDGESGGNDLAFLIRRFARTHAPFAAVDPARRWTLPQSAVDAVCRELVENGHLLLGHFRPAGSQPELCHPEVLQQLRRRSLAALRREVEAVPRQTLARFLPSWHGAGSRARGIERLLECIDQLQGLPLPFSALERDIFPARMEGYAPALLDELIAAGEVVWVGEGSLGRDDGRVVLLRRDRCAELLDDVDEPVQGELAAAIRDQLQARGACFLRELLAVAPPGTRADDLVDVLWEMVWSGEVTNDTMAPLRQVGPSRRSRRPMARLIPPRGQGRWSLVAMLRAGAPPATQRLAAITGQLLARHGVLTRESTLGEGVRGGFAGIYPVLRAMEEAGRIRRGYFVEGLGAAQFALPGAVDSLRAHREPSGAVLLLSAVDPANAYGAVVPWPEASRRPARTAGAHVVLEGGELRLYVERGGRTLLSFGEVTARHVEQLRLLAERSGKLEITSIDGGSVAASPLAALLREAGFEPTPRGLVLWPRTAGRMRAAV